VKKTAIGIVGCGNISGIYFANCKSFEVLKIKSCTDLIASRSEAKAKEHGCLAVSGREILADPEIEIIVNLTPPKVHYEVAMAAVKAGKSVHNEKPLTITRAQAARLLSEAKKRKVRVGGAPDTFLGGGIQTCKKLVDDGWIGKPIGATAFMMCHGHESWHPDPEFYYKVGGGPMFDMGPYYLTAMIALMGPVRRAAGMTRVTFPKRTITSAPKNGTQIVVDVPTHVSGLLEFHNGAICSIITSFDVWGSELPRIEIYGTTGSLSVPDPNCFGGPVKLLRPGSGWTEMPLTHGYAENSRGIAVADMAYGLRSSRPHRASGALANHVLDIMHAIHDAAKAGRTVTLASRCEAPAPLPMDLRRGTLDD